MPGPGRATSGALTRDGRKKNCDRWQAEPSGSQPRWTGIRRHRLTPAQRSTGDTQAALGRTLRAADRGRSGKRRSIGGAGSRRDRCDLQPRTPTDTAQSSGPGGGPAPMGEGRSATTANTWQRLSTITVRIQQKNPRLSVRRIVALFRVLRAGHRGVGPAPAGRRVGSGR